MRVYRKGKKLNNPNKVLRQESTGPEILRSSFVLAPDSEKDELRRKLLNEVSGMMPRVHKKAFAEALRAGVLTDDHIVALHHEATGKNRFNGWLPNTQITSGQFVEILRKRLGLDS